MKQKGKLILPILFYALLILVSCDSKTKVASLPNFDRKDAENSVLFSMDSAAQIPIVAEMISDVKQSLQTKQPVVLCKDSLNSSQQKAEKIALTDSAFTQFFFDPYSKQPYRNEIFGVYPARESDLTGYKGSFNLNNTYRIEMYNYALDNTSIALVDIQQEKVLLSYYLKATQPDLSKYLTHLATSIAIESPEVQEALGIKPNEKEALMAATKTSLNRSKCERSRHLCVAPTFVKGDKALWAIVDLTDLRLVGIRWTQVGTPGKPAPMMTERRLQDDKITSCFCEVEQSLKKDNWDMKYMLTSSDGLRISDVTFNGKKILRSAKLVDWHVSYSGTDGFGYSDAVGCPYFSQAAVIAWEAPKVADLVDDKNQKIGFVLEQTFRSEGWPTPCNYNYKQRYEFYNDGRFRVACASIGRGCGNNGTYRPVFRIAFAADQSNFYQWSNNKWDQWNKEKWNEQNSLSTYSSDGFLYKISSLQYNYGIIPGHGQFNDGGRGDFSFLYVTKNIMGKEEGENDLPTIGPCCNNDYRQGPEKFIEPQPDDIQNAPLVVWYVAQLRCCRCNCKPLS